jgi:hypothetical protein
MSSQSIAPVESRIAWTPSVEEVSPAVHVAAVEVVVVEVAATAALASVAWAMELDIPEI